MTNIQQNVTEEVAYLKSVAAEQGYNIPLILREKAAVLRTKKAAHNHERADAYEAAAAEIEAAEAMGKPVMTLAGIANAIIERDGAGSFINDFSGHYDISRDEAERIAARASSLDEFEAIWQNQDWWTDANN